MAVPGSNLLSMAARVISQQAYLYLAFAARVTADNGQDVTIYAPAVSLKGSIQAVGRQLFQQLGLDFNKTYRMFFVQQDAIDVQRDVSGDHLIFQGDTYECLSITPWYSVDGWNQIVAVRVQPTPVITAMVVPLAQQYNTGDALQFSVSFSYLVNVSAVSYLALAGRSDSQFEANANYTSGSGTNTLNFSYTVQSGDAAVGISVTSPVQGAIVGLTNIPANAYFITPDLSGIILN